MHARARVHVVGIGQWNRCDTAEEDTGAEEELKTEAGEDTKEAKSVPPKMKRRSRQRVQ